MTFLPRIKQCLTLIGLFMVSGVACAEKTLNMTRGVTDVSRSIYSLHMMVFWICVAIGVVVFSVMIYAMIFHRKSRGAVAADFHEHATLEVVWAILPLVILVAMAIPATKVLMSMSDTSEADVTIKITGYQWKWKYDYLDQGINYFSNLATSDDEIHNKKQKDQWYLLDVDKPLVLPINKKIRFLVTANDVIHSWWVPELAVKRDAIPGFIHEAWTKIKKPGTFRGQCAELCGMNHAYMPIVVKAVAEDEFDQWVKLQQGEKAKAAAEDFDKVYTKAELMKLGQDGYGKYCAACHKPDGTGTPPVFPALKGSPVTTGKPISNHIKVVLNGRTGTAMQSFGPQLTNTLIAGIVTYERNAFGNNTGDLVQPIEVKKLR